MRHLKVQPCVEELNGLVENGVKVNGLKDAADATKCPEKKGILAEADAIVKYKAMLKQVMATESPASSSVLSVLHNIVTASAGNQFPEGRGGLYRVSEALSGHPCSFVQDVVEQFPRVEDTVLAQVDGEATIGLPGISADELAYFVPPVSIVKTAQKRALAKRSALRALAE